MSQPTIFKLIHDNKTGSAHLHKVARELGTTPAFLTGETDDPKSNVPDEAELTGDERVIVDCLRMIPAKDRAALIQLARSLAATAVNVPTPVLLLDPVPTPTLQSQKQTFRGQ